MNIHIKYIYDYFEIAGDNTISDIPKNFKCKGGIVIDGNPGKQSIEKAYPDH